MLACGRCAAGLGTATAHPALPLSPLPPPPLVRLEEVLLGWAPAPLMLLLQEGRRQE